MKTQLSSLEITALVKELQFLVDGKIDQIYQPEKKEFLVYIHLPRQGKQLLKVQLPGFIYLTQEKPEMQPPTEFCLNLRKILNNSVIKEVQQLHSERIIQIKLQKEQVSFLIVELFSRGNLIVTDEQKEIIALLEKQKWGTRELKIKEKYQAPPVSFDFTKSSLKELKELVQQSQKNQIITCLATEVGLGGTYAEEICQRINLNKKLPPQSLTEAQIKGIFNQIQIFLKELQKPQGFVYESKDITPLRMEIYQNFKEQIFPSFNQALDSSLGKSLVDSKKEKQEKKFQKQIQEIEHIIEEQNETIKRLESQEKVNTQRGNYIYERYQEINSFLNKVKQAKQKLSWEDLKKELQKYPQIKQVYLKEKKVVLEL